MYFTCRRGLISDAPPKLAVFPNNFAGYGYTTVMDKVKISHKNEIRIMRVKFLRMEDFQEDRGGIDNPAKREIDIG